MKELLKRVLFFFCREVGESGVEKDSRQAFLIRGHILQTTKKPSRYDVYGRE